jgi:hypothetical protein
MYTGGPARALASLRRAVAARSAFRHPGGIAV